MVDTLQDIFIKGYMGSRLVMERMAWWPPEGKPSISSPWTCALLAQCITLSDGPHLEIGTRFGSSALLATMFTDNKITCVDPMEYLEDSWFSNRYLGHVATWKTNMETWKVEDQVDLVVALSHPLPVTGPFATVYIDGDHTYEAALQDFMNVKDITTDFIIWDDLEKESVYTAFMEALRADSQWRAAFMCYTTGVMVNREHDGNWDHALSVGNTAIIAAIATKGEE